LIAAETLHIMSASILIFRPVRELLNAVYEPLGASGSCPTRNCVCSASMFVLMVDRAEPGASPTPTIPSSVWISTSSPDGDKRVPPGDERLAHRA